MIRLLLGLLLALCAQAAPAHTRSESHGSWTIDGRSAGVTFTVSDVEARRLTEDGRPPNDRQLIAYLAGKVYAKQDGGRCAAQAPPRAVRAVPGFRRVELRFLCGQARGIVLHSDAFFDLVPTHVNMAQIQRQDGELVQQMATADARDIALDGAHGEGIENAGFLEFVRMGVMHIFTGIDHMAFLLGLVLISRRLRDLAFVVTGFTLGHSLTLALAVTGLLRPHAEFIDALVALTIALIGFENIAIQARRPGLVALWIGGGLAVMGLMRLAGIGLLPASLLFGAAIFSANYVMVTGHLRDAGRLRLVVALVFGLIHGFGFAADLLSSPIPAARLAELLVGFNLGVEAGQLTLVMSLWGLVHLARRWRLALPRPIVVDVTASALVAVGTYWFVSRSFA